MPPNHELTNANYPPTFCQWMGLYSRAHEVVCGRIAKLMWIVKRHRWAVAMAFLGLDACSLGPRYTRPDIPAPADWRTSEQSAPTQQSSNQLQTPTWPSTVWMRGFNSPQLDELIGQAQAANDDIGAAIARVREADAQVRVAGAALLPSVSANADASRQRQISRTQAASSFNSFSPTLAASYEVDFWGKNRAIRDAARMAATASRYDRATVELTVLTSVVTTYFQTLELRDRLRVAEENLTRGQTVLDDLRLQQEVGIVTALDVAQQATTVATLRAVVPPLKQQLLQTIDALAILIGKEPQAVNLGDGTLADLAEPRVSPGLPSELLARRPDVAAAEAQLMAANANIAAARAAFFPSIALTAGGGYMSTALATLFTPATRIFSVTGGLTQPIFQGGALSGQYQLDKARYAELVSDYHKAVISAFSNVQDALVAVQQTADQEQRQQDAVNEARDAYELSQAQWHAGIINILTVLNTETVLFTAQDALVQVRSSHMQALVALFGALGGGWQRA
jgi:multidrug efflux system outer membrane protein